VLTDHLILITPLLITDHSPVAITPLRTDAQSDSR